MPNDSGFVFYNEDPGKYVYQLWKEAQKSWDGQKSRIQEQYDMYLGYDDYINERASQGLSALSFPLIFAHVEARLATMLELMNSEENFIRFEAIQKGDSQAEMAAERLEAGFANIRADLDWDQKFLDLFQACEIFDYNWISLEAETIPIRPGTGITAGSDLQGTDKTYPSFGLYHPGRVWTDGHYERESEIPAKFKVSFMTYQDLKLNYPERVQTWMLDRSQLRSEVDYLVPDDWNSSSHNMGHIYDGEGGSDDERRGFLVVEAHVNAIFSDNTCRQRILTFLPEITASPKSAEDAQWGYLLEEGAKPYDSVEDLIFMARGRSLPFSTKGKGTSDLLVPFQRDFSDQVSTERDLDRLYQAPPIAMRSEFYIGKEQPSLNPYEILNFRDTAETRNIPLDHFVKPLVTPTPNRAYAVETRNTIQNLMDLISGAVEAQTGGVDINPNKTATAFSGRARAAARRVMVPFRQHSRTIQRVIRSMLAMMQETPQEFLYPHILASSTNLGPGVLTPNDVGSAVHVRVPALSEYANRELAKVMSRMIAEGLMQLPIVADSPSGQMMIAEHLLRQQQFGEENTQRFLQGLQGDLQAAARSAALQALTIQEGNGNGQSKAVAPGNSTPVGRVGPGQVSQAANLSSNVTGG